MIKRVEHHFSNHRVKTVRFRNHIRLERDSSSISFIVRWRDGRRKPPSEATRESLYKRALVYRFESYPDYNEELFFYLKRMFYIWILKQNHYELCRINIKTWA